MPPNPFAGFARRREARGAEKEKAYRTLTYESSVLMTMAQAVRAMGESGEANRWDRDSLGSSVLATAVRHGYSPSLPEDSEKRRIFEMLARELGQDPRPTFTSLAAWATAKRPFTGVPPQWIFISGAGDDHRTATIEAEFHRLSFTHRDDMQTMFVRQFASYFGTDEPGSLHDEDRNVLVHAGYTLVTVFEDVKNADADEAEERVAIACRFEAELLDQAVRSSRYRTAQEAEQRAREAAVRQSGVTPDDFRGLWSWEPRSAAALRTSSGRTCIESWELNGVSHGISRFYVVMHVAAASEATGEERQEIADYPWEVVLFNLGVELVGRFTTREEAVSAAEGHALDFSYRSARGEA